MKSLLLFITVFAGITPLLIGRVDNEITKHNFPGWPSSFRGRALVQLPLTEKEKTFTRDFPGELGRFTDGEHELIIRWIQRESRRLHPASDCLKGNGYSISDRPIELSPEGNQWGCFQASSRENTLHVCERIFDDSGNSWSDVSSWFWAALTRKSEGPWWAMTVARKR